MPNIIRVKNMYFITLFLIIPILASAVEASPSYRGYSGAPGRQTCASSCHGLPGGTVQVTGFPESYSPGQSYLITIQRLSGNSIRQFNGSCRVGTSSANAGTLSAGTNTETYNVSGETNGVHLSSSSQNSATFNWTAPVVGTGTVRLYVGAYQGSSTAGYNTTIVQVSGEASSGPPAAASNPSPADSAQDVLPNVVMSWTAGSGAASHDIYFGANNPPDSVTNQIGTSYDPPGNLDTATTYYWRVDERNSEGVTAGEVWQFTTLSVPAAASDPSPADSAMEILPSATLSWTAGDGAISHDVYFGTADPPAFIMNQTTTTYDPPGNMQPGTMYFWRIDERNPAGVTTGDVWQFTILPFPDQASNPSPADGATGISLDTTLSWMAGDGATSHDLFFGLTDPPAFVVSQTDTFYPIAESLLYDTVYYWRVDERNAAGVTTGTLWSFHTRIPSAKEPHDRSVAAEFALGPIYPNPFNAVVTISFSLPSESNVALTLWDVTGRQIADLSAGKFSAGAHQISWSAENIGSGIYFVRLAAQGKIAAAKVIALK